MTKPFIMIATKLVFSNRLTSTRSSINRLIVRAFAVKPPVGHPLELLRQSAERRLLCDSQGLRLPDANWVLQIAVAQPFTAAPSLKTVTFQQVSTFGLDFVMKRPEQAISASTTRVLRENPPVSILYKTGEYKEGDTVEQWLGEGTVKEIDLKELISTAPNYGLAGILASKRATDQLRKIEGIVSQAQEPIKTEVYRTRIEKHAKFIELVQQTRRELENGNVTREELEDAIIAFRFVPDRMERMIGGPDMITWERWEWKMQTDKKGLSSSDVRQLLPF